MTKKQIRTLIIIAAILIVLTLAGGLIAQAVISKHNEPVVQTVESTNDDMQVSGSKNEVSALSLAVSRSTAKTTAATVFSDIATLSDNPYISLGVPLSTQAMAQFDQFFGSGKYEVVSPSKIVVNNNLNGSTRTDVLFLRNTLGGNFPMQMYWALLPNQNVFADTGNCEVYNIVFTYDGAEKSPYTAYPQFVPDGFEMYSIQSISKQITVTYNLYQLQTAVPLPADPVKEGHTFVGWYFDSAFTQRYDGSPIYEDTQLYAKFEINRYTVTFDFDGGSGSPHIEHVDWNTAASNNTPTRDGYGFDGWYMPDGTKYTNQPIKSDITLTARWYRNRFTVKFNSDGGSLVSDRVVMLNNTFSYPLVTPTKEGYNFMGWYMSDGTQYTNQPVTDDMTLTAHWEIKVYTVNFYVDGELYSTMEVEHGSQLVQVASEQNLVVMSVYSDSADFSAEALKTKGVTTDLTVTAAEMSNKDKVINTVKNNKWQIIGGVVAGVVFISVIAVIVGCIKRKNAEGYDYE